MSRHLLHTIDRMAGSVAFRLSGRYLFPLRNWSPGKSTWGQAELKMFAMVPATNLSKGDGRAGGKGATCIPSLVSGSTRDLDIIGQRQPVIRELALCPSLTLNPYAPC